MAEKSSWRNNWKYIKNEIIGFWLYLLIAVMGTEAG
jgi:hypothetical protein